MSLISDALKTAQRTRSENSGTESIPSRISGGFVPVRDSRPAGPAIRWAVVAPLIVLTLVLGISARLFLNSRTPRPAPNVRIVPPAVPNTASRNVQAPPSATPVAPQVAAPAGVASSQVRSEVRPEVRSEVRPEVRREVRREAPAPVVTAPRRNVVADVPEKAFRGPQPIERSSTNAPKTTDSIASNESAQQRSEPRREQTAPDPVAERAQVSVKRSDDSYSQIFAQALAAQQRGDLTRARDLYERAVSRDSSVAQTYNNLGLVYTKLGDMPRALTALHRAVALDANSSDAWNNLGLVFLSLGRGDEAIASLNNALRLDRDNRGAKVNLALAYRSRGMTTQARRLLEEVIAHGAPIPEAHYALGSILEEAGDRAGAVQQYGLFLSTAGGRFAANEAMVRERIQQLKRP